MSQAIIKLSDIDVGYRERKDYKDLDSLANSIEKRGLINPIAISIHPEIENKYLLAAGGRRLAAVKLLKQEEIMCRIYDHVLSDLELLSIELEENIKREDLEYPEGCRLSRRIRDIQDQIHGIKTSTAPDAPGVSLRDTANLLGVSHATLSRDISLADAIDKFPELQLDKCKNKSEAMKIKEKAEMMMIRQALAEGAMKTLGKEDALRSKLVSSYILGDFFENIKGIPGRFFKLVEIDPPYAIDLKRQKKVDKNLRFSRWLYGKEGYNEISKEDYPEFMQKTFKECYRVMAPDSWLLCWFGPDPWFEPIYQWIIEAGFETRRLTAKWVKGEDSDKDGYVERTSGQTMQPSMYLANASEQFYYARKGNPTLARPGRTNIFGYKPIPPASKIHPTERPLDLMQDILTTFAIEGSRVLVPYAGSGNTLIASAMSKMIPTGFDLTMQYKEGYILRVQDIFK